jgi:uncharacterized protein RhaS with RHS repeats
MAVRLGIPTGRALACILAGNRTGVWLNGTRTVTQTFNAANQIDGFSYDAAGNLTGDGTTTYGYDALGRSDRAACLCP